MTGTFCQAIDVHIFTCHKSTIMRRQPLMSTSMISPCMEDDSKLKAKMRKWICIGLLVFLLCRQFWTAFQAFQIPEKGSREVLTSAFFQSPAFSERNVGFDSSSIPIHLQNRLVGHITPLCRHRHTSTANAPRNESSHQDTSSLIHDCNILPPLPSQPKGCATVNGPIVIRAQHPSELKGRIVLITSNHKTSHHPIRMFLAPQGWTTTSLSRSILDSLDSSGELDFWTEVTPQISIEAIGACEEKAIHSPDILYSPQENLYYMHAHLHRCKQHGKQPTAVFTSPDLLHWNISNVADPFVANNLFYARLFHYKGQLYGIAKSQETSTGSMVLFESTSFRSDYKVIHKLAQGVRHVGLHRKQDTLFIFFTLIGDEPERIFLSTIDLTQPPSKWELRPGPEIMKPPNTNSPLKISKPGAAPCHHVQELRDPFFFPDEDEAENQLKGTLFYTLAGEQAIGASSLRIDLDAYFHLAIPFRNQSNIDPLVYDSSSLSSNQDDDVKERPLLITGVGRSGTTFVCEFFNALARKNDPNSTWQISHDNEKDCGPFGGTVGASSWLHAFRFRTSHNPYVTPLHVQRVIHVIRHPLKIIKSRLARHQSMPWASTFVLNMTFSWEDLEVEVDSAFLENTTSYSSLFLRHWINRNSFVQNHASWRIKNEDLVTPFHIWLLCLEMGLPNYPNLEMIRETLAESNHAANTNGKVSNYDDPDIHWWRRMMNVNRDDVRIALKMKEEYGYVDDESDEDMKALYKELDIDSVRYKCSFANDKNVRSGLEKDPRHWGCSLV